MTFIEYQLNVTGTLWCGAEANYSYKLPDNPARHPKTIAEAKPLCGDFQSLDTAEIVTIHKTIESKSVELK
jgi:hypothetical protein